MKKISLIIVSFLLLYSCATPPIIQNRKVQTIQVPPSPELKQKGSLGKLVLIRKNQGFFAPHIPVVIFNNDQKIGVLAAKGNLQWQTTSASNTLYGVRGDSKKCMFTNNECLTSTEGLLDVKDNSKPDTNVLNIEIQKSETKYYLLILNHIVDDEIKEIDSQYANELIKKYN